MEQGNGFATETSFSDEAWNRYVAREEPVRNSRLRGDGEEFLDALLSVDMSATPERRAAMEAVGKLD